MTTLSYMEASKRALAEEMRRDATVWCVGEDLGRGGVFGQYTGLVDEFGAQRISDAPISEACIMGAAVGAAMMGTRPVVVPLSVPGRWGCHPKPWTAMTSWRLPRSRKKYSRAYGPRNNPSFCTSKPTA